MAAEPIQNPLVGPDIDIHCVAQFVHCHRRHRLEVADHAGAQYGQSYVRVADEPVKRRVNRIQSCKIRLRFMELAGFDAGLTPAQAIDVAPLIEKFRSQAMAQAAGCAGNENAISHGSCSEKSVYRSCSDGSYNDVGGRVSMVNMAGQACRLSGHWPQTRPAVATTRSSLAHC